MLPHKNYVLRQLAHSSPEHPEELVARIDRIVRCRTGGNIRDLQVQLHGQDVVLTGVANTYYAKQLATHAALDEIADRPLTNSIEVS